MPEHKSQTWNQRGSWYSLGCLEQEGHKAGEKTKQAGHSSPDFPTQHRYLHLGAEGMVPIPWLHFKGPVVGS